MERLTVAYKDENNITMYERKNVDIKNQHLIDKLGELEDKQEQGLLIELPCKVGGTVYALTPFCEICEEDLDYGYTCENCSNGNFVSETKFDYEMIPMFGKVVFLTRSEAEEALARMKGENKAWES